MDGFVDSYVRQKSTGLAPNPIEVMHYFTPDQVPVISQLATAFGVSDQWHASAPCQTWPNRFFAHTGTADGLPNNTPLHVFAMPTIFKRLGDRGRSWKVYYHDLPQAATLADIWLDAPAHFKLFDEEFAKDAVAGDLPNYSFIEPRYFTDEFGKLLPNDQHPPHNVVYGEQLIAAVYNAVRSAPTWKKTLLIITYDEHGGCYDHVPPPLAVAPDPKRVPGSFAFDRYGVRVPAVIISPYMPAGEIVRVAPTGLPHQGPPYPFDHTSILATLRKLFNLGDPLTAREAIAPDLIGPLSLENPDNDGPASISPTPAVPSDAEIAQTSALPANQMQKSLCAMAAHLPPTAAQAGAHLSAVAPVSASAPAAQASGLETKQYAADRLRSFLA
jgi:phospholipase C